MRTAAWLVVLGGLASCGGGASGGRPPAPATHASTRTVVDDGQASGDDGLDVVSARGHMDPDELATCTQRHAADLSACFVANAVDKRWLGGQLTLHWEVAADGSVAALRVTESDVGSWAIEQCVLQVARAMVMPAPHGGPGDFDLPLEFPARSHPTFWDEDQGIAAVGGQLQGLAQCDARTGGPATHPSSVLVTAYVGRGGKAQSVGFSTAAVAGIDDAWATCAAAKVMGWRLPDPRGHTGKLAVLFRPQPTTAGSAGDSQQAEESE